MKEFWDDRYNQTTYVYGEEPNLFFKENLDKLEVGRILLPAEGEGRNAVYAARKMWQVEAFDQSAQGREKAMKLAEKYQVSFSYTIGGIGALNYPPASFDLIAFIYTHTPANIRSHFHANLLPYLKSGGYVILEGFSKAHRKHQQDNPHAGGPREEDMLYSVEEIPLLFPGLETLALTEQEIILSEGIAHKGEASVIRYIGRKI